MANYGPTGGRYPEQSGDPWYSDQNADQNDEWDRWEERGPGRAYEDYRRREAGYVANPDERFEPTYEAPTEEHPSYRPDRYDTQEAEPPAKRGPTGLIITLVAVLVVVLCGAGALGYYLLKGGNDKTPAAQTQPSPTQSNSPTASAAPSYNPTSIIKGECVVNDGDDQAPKLRVVGCGPNTFQVQARFDGTKDDTKCDTVAGSTHKYFYDTTPDTLDFVLCLKKQ
jgi:hypothetical protein